MSCRQVPSADAVSVCQTVVAGQRIPTFPYLGKYLYVIVIFTVCPQRLARVRRIHDGSVSIVNNHEGFRGVCLEMVCTAGIFKEV